MKVFLLLLAILGFFGIITCNIQKTAVSDETTEIKPEPPKENRLGGKIPVLVELFTSEGCSSCPPADRTLTFLQQQQPVKDAEIIALSLHVDYWDYLGWKDEFSSAQFSQRQNFYSTVFNSNQVYTPQMIVDGTSQFVGSNMSEAIKAIDAALKIQKAQVNLAVNQNKLSVTISDMPEHQKANVFLAIAEDNLSTSVKRGENGGQTLPHSAVVRELRTIGSLTASDKKFQTEIEFQTKANWKKDNLKLVIFIQAEQDNKIIGINQIKL